MATVEPVATARISYANTNDALGEDSHGNNGPRSRHDDEGQTKTLGTKYRLMSM